MGGNTSQALDPSFKEIFDSSVDSAMLVLGESERQAVCYHLEKTFEIEKNTWHKDVEHFAGALETLFGSGA